MSNDKQRERLVELHQEAGSEWNTYLDRCIDEGIEPEKTYDEFHADYLLENGVTVPPCKVGDTVYCVFEDDVIEDEIILIEVTESAIYLSTCTERYMWLNGYLYSEMLDQKLYITKEEAEEALKGGDIGG